MFIDDFFLQAEAKGMFIEDKIDLLVLYLIARPFENLARPFLEKFLKVICHMRKTRTTETKRYPIYCICNICTEDVHIH